MKRQGRAKKRNSTKLRDVLRQAWQDYEEHGGIPHDRFWKELAELTAPRKKKNAGTR